MLINFTITKVTEKTWENGTRWNVKIRKELDHPILGKSSRTFYFTSSLDKFVEGELLPIELDDFEVREFEYTIPGTTKPIKLKALAHKLKE